MNNDINNNYECNEYTEERKRKKKNKLLLSNTV